MEITNVRKDEIMDAEEPETDTDGKCIPVKCPSSMSAVLQLYSVIIQFRNSISIHRYR